MYHHCITLNYCAAVIYYVILNFDKTYYNKFLENNQKDFSYFIMVNSAKIQDKRIISYVTTQQEEEVLTTNF